MRIRRSIIVGTLAVLAIPTLSGTASAGGSWLTPERSAYVPAEIAVMHGRFSTGSLEGRIADGPYIAYLLPLDRWIQDEEVPAGAIRLGELRIVRTSSHGFHARVAFEVPKVPTGMYHVQYCNDPCTVDGIGDLTGSDAIAIGATWTKARLLLLEQRLSWKIERAVERARQRALTERTRLQMALAQATEGLRTAEARVGQLAEELGETRRALRIERSSGPSQPLIGGLLALGLGLIAAIIVLASRLRAARIDVELQALTHAESIDRKRAAVHRP